MDAAEAQARSRSLDLPETSTPPPPPTGQRPRGALPPGAQPSDIGQQRGIIRKSPAPDQVLPPRPSAPPRLEPGARSTPSISTAPPPGPAEPPHTYKVPVPAPALPSPAPSTPATAPQPLPGTQERAILRKIITPGPVTAQAEIVDLQRDAGGAPVDSRRQVDLADLAALPFSAIGQIVVQLASGGSQIGTGFLIEPGIVLTAAHVLHSPALGRAARAVFTPACRTQGVPNKPAAVAWQAVGPDRYRVSDAWTRGDRSLAADYGAMLLADALAFVDCGVLSVAPVEETFVRRHARLGSGDFMVAGFPDDKPQGTQWYGRGGVLVSPAVAIRHVVDTMPGQSGAPLFVIVLSQTSGRKVPMALGIHSRPAELAGNYNQSRRIDAHVLADLKRWTEQAPPDRR